MPQLLLLLQLRLLRVANHAQFTQALQANLEQDKAVKVTIRLPLAFALKPD
jgi:hypothetical protein